MAAFERLLCYVLDSYGIVAPEEAEKKLKGKGLSSTDDRIPYLLTFDDGFKSNLSVARDVLDRYGVKAVFFVCPGLIDTPQERQRETITTHIFDGDPSSSDFPDELSLLSWTDLESLVASGHTIGSHTGHHRRVSKLNTEEQWHEIIESAALLEKRLGTSIKWFAYPFGTIDSIDGSSLNLIAKQYEFCCSGIRGVNSGSTHPLGLLRESLDLASPIEYQKLVLDGGLDFYYATRVGRLRRMIEEGVLRQRQTAWERARSTSSAAENK